MTCITNASKIGFICSPINDLSIFDLIKKLFLLRTCLHLFWLKHLGYKILQGRLLKSQLKFQPDRHKQALSESHGCDLCQGECHRQCARANLIEADVLPCQHEPIEKLLLTLTPSTL